MSIALNKLICSFKSDLPNEIDFAMQVATLLANTENFSWSKDFALVDAICLSLHVFTCVCRDDTITGTCDCYPRFWHKILTGKQASNPYLQAATVPPEIEQSFLNFNNLVDHTIEDHDKIYKRIKLAAELIKQFSMTCDAKVESENSTETDTNNYNYNQYTKKKKSKSSPSLLKFVSLLLFCDDVPLNLVGLDLLSNIASKLSKLPESSTDFTCNKLVQMFQEHSIENIGCPDGDIYIIIRSMEIISRLISSSNPRVYSNIVNLINERNILLRIEQLLTSRNDVNLFLAALECFYRISRHQPHIIASGRAQHLIKILVNLLNCEDRRFFTSNALKRIGMDGKDDGTVTQNLTQTTACHPSQLVDQTQTQQRSHQGQNQPKTAPKLATRPQPQAKSQPPPQINIQPRFQEKPSSQPQLQVQTHIQPTIQIQVQPQPQILLTPLKEYLCEWNGCKKKFSDTKQVYTHVFETHVETLSPNELSTCLWMGPNGTGPGCLTKRPKYSLLTHLNDYHCNSAALERALTRSDPIKPPEHPGYGPNAALMALKRHANVEKNVSKALNHSPLSVSVRLTSALILRNLATQSAEMKQALGYYEPLLSEICMTNGRDESKIIAECLSLFSRE